MSKTILRERVREWVSFMKTGGVNFMDHETMTATRQTYNHVFAFNAI